SLAYATSDRGACHLRATFYKAELSGMIAPETIDGKAEMFIDFEDRLTIMDTLILCRFYRDFYLWDELSEIIRLTTGLNLNKERLQGIALDVTNLVKEYNFREGMTDNDNKIPERFFKEPFDEVKDNLKKEEFETLIDRYYKLRKWK
ncbi:MAG: aldehyde ferredoxin oxidoreductase C-terminal domain-containing protein, partial [Thermodesulfovibrionales bacterium]|nr:aldehyde ferredoxin oxidoreductase C-terminal domain-containing protein [Thermodesulfovibrionales bacterium]